MDTAKLKKFAQFARRSLIEQVSAKSKLVLVPESVARREKPTSVDKLEKAIREMGKEQVNGDPKLWDSMVYALCFQYEF